MPPANPATVEQHRHVRRDNLLWLVVFLLAGLLGFVGAYKSVGPEVLAGDRTEMLSAKGDAAIGMAGFRYFVDEPWGLPLLHSEKLDGPDGTVIAFTDSIPLLALTAKAVRFLSVSVEAWWGLWFAAAFVGQGIGGAYAVGRWTDGSKVLALASVPLFVMFPPFLLRMFHPALAFQLPLLLAVGLVAALRRRPRRIETILAIVLPTVALLIHPYHALSAAILIAAAVAEGYRAESLSGRWVARWAALSALILGVTAAVGGYLTEGAVPVEGYGTYSLIPYSPIYPQLSRVWPGDDDFLLSNGTFEGFAFLGAGSVAIVVLALLIGVRSGAWRAVTRHPSMAVGLGTIFLFAVTTKVSLTEEYSLDFIVISNRLTAGHTTVAAGVIFLASAMVVVALLRRGSLSRRSFAWHAPLLHVMVAAAFFVLLLLVPASLARFTGTFRASGRLVWVCCYFGVVGAVGVVGRRSPKGVALAVVCLASAVQWHDQQQLRQFDASLYVQDGERRQTIDGLAALVAQHEAVHLVPEYTCTALGPVVEQYIDVVVAASISGVPIDNTYSARRASVVCPIEQALDPDADVVTISAVPDLLLAGRDDDCRTWQIDITVCSTRWDQISPELLSEFGPPD